MVGLFGIEAEQGLANERIQGAEHGDLENGRRAILGLSAREWT
jgi:hypothetical protein